MRRDEAWRGVSCRGVEGVKGVKGVSARPRRVEVRGFALLIGVDPPQGSGPRVSRGSAASYTDIFGHLAALLFSIVFSIPFNIDF